MIGTEICTKLITYKLNSFSYLNQLTLEFLCNRFIPLMIMADMIFLHTRTHRQN